MGQIFNRFKRLVKANVGAVASTITDKILENDFLRKKWEASNKFREGVGDKFEEGQEYVREAWEDLTTNVPYSLRKSYETLDVAFGLPLDEVRKAWKKKLQKHHPDLFSDAKEREAATKKAAEINEAFQKIEKYFNKGVV